MSVRKSRRGKAINILASDIKSTSTCIDLNIGYDFSCDSCKAKKDAAIGMPKKSSVGQKDSANMRTKAIADAFSHGQHVTTIQNAIRLQYANFIELGNI